MRYSILIIEADSTRRSAWAEALLQAAALRGCSLTVTAARSTVIAQFHAGRKLFHLLVAPLNSDNIRLAGRLRDRNAQLRALLLHAPNAPDADLREARWSGHILNTYPETPTKLVCAVGQMLGIALDDDREVYERPSATLGDVHMLLDVLRWQTKAQIAIYTDYIGNLIAHRGDSNNLDMSTVTSLIAGSFVSSFELGRALRDPHTRHLSVIEGESFDVFATNVGSHRLLALVFDKAFVNPKLGYAWLLLKRNADQLSQIRIVEGNVSETFSAELTASLNNEFNRLFGNDLLGIPESLDNPLC